MTGEIGGTGGMRTADSQELPPGTVIGSYQIEQVAGWGGMGVVYRAAQRRPLRTVALKVIRPDLAADPEFRRRFEHEADSAASIEHPNVLPIYEAGEFQGLLYLAMRYIDGTDLREWLVKNGPMPPARAADIVLQVGKALDAAHAQGLVHRDIKPGNILLSQQRDEDHVFLTDFGLTKKSSAAAQFTRTGTWVGTVDYVAPEQIRGEQIDARSDVYSLGCVLYQLVSGKVPFDRDTEVSKIFAHLNEPPPSVGLVSPLLDEVIKKALAKDPNDRYASAGDLGRAAVAAAQMRSIDVGSNSVATGAAAPSGVNDPGATRIDDPNRYGAGPAVTAPGGAAPLAQPPTQGPGQQPPPGTPPPGYGQPGGPPPGYAQPVSPPAGYGQPISPPGAYAAPPQAPASKRRKPLIPVLIGVGVLVIAAVVVVVVAMGGSSNSGTSSVQLVKDTVSKYWTTPGSGACNYLSSGELNRNWGGFAGCARAFAQDTSTRVHGTQQVQINGLTATDSGFTAAQHPWKFSLVKQGHKWLIDFRANLDTAAIETLATNWAGAVGGNVCNYFSPQNINTHYHGSLAACQAAQKNNAAATISGTQTVVYQSTPTSAVDTFSLNGGSHWKMETSKQSNGSWLIDLITKS